MKEDLFDLLDEEERGLLDERDLPSRLSPMLATLTDERFSDDGWIFERKVDGERCLGFGDGERVRLRSRNGKDITNAYPELAEALEAVDGMDFVVDGEVVAFEGNVTSFSKLQPRMQIDDPDEARRSDVRVFLYLFDLVHLAGHDTTSLALRTRKRLLRRLFQYEDPLRFMSHRNAEGEDFYRRACEKGWEGIIAKKADSAYVQKRSRDWLKMKCSMGQELVIGGWTEPHGERIGFGALLMGYYRDDTLRYAGKVGTGYDDETLERLSRRLASRERETSPFAGDEDLPGKEVHWATPDLVAEVAFTEWTEGGKLRHPRFKGLRRDKQAEDVVREDPS